MGWIATKLISGIGKRFAAEVDREHSLVTVERARPPLDQTIFPVPYRKKFANSSGVENMNVDGSSNSVDFTVNASNDFDIFIKTIFVEIEDGGSPSLNKFGALTALTNGVGWYYFTQEEGEYELHEGIKTNKEFIKTGIDTHGIGTGTEAYLADVSGGGTSKSYLPIIDFAEMTGMKYGVRLRKNTTDRLIFRISDSLTGLVTFNAIAWGQRIKT